MSVIFPNKEMRLCQNYSHTVWRAGLRKTRVNTDYYKQETVVT